jgi:hypothetical protein
MYFSCGSVERARLKVVPQGGSVRDHMELDFTMQDPKALAKPWTTTWFYELRPNLELGEISCSGDYLDFSNFEK